MTAAQPAAARPPWHVLMPPLFVLLYRFVIVALLLLAIALATRAPWPRQWRFIGHIAVVGVFLQGMYLGGVYAAIDRGIPAGISALIVGLQPIVTGVVAGPLLGERVTMRQWLGLTLGLFGIGLVLWQKLSLDVGQLEGVAWNVVGLIGITAATLYQKRYCSQMDWRSGGVIQYVAAAAVTAGMMLIMSESGAIVWTHEIVVAYAWLILVLSIGAVSLLGWLIRRGEASRVASLFYLVPPTAALGGWLLFGETLGPLAIAGMAVTVLGVALAARR
jgi:drug/metabolite transporter (DMT)-like permease